LQDMVDRITVGRKNATDYITGTAAPLGGTSAVVDCAGFAGGHQRDLCEWGNALLGASEKKGAANVGAMIGARGCIINPVATMPREFVVAVVWQGLAPTVAPATTVCGKDLYGDDKMRRAMVARVVIGCLQNDPTTGVCVTP
jgi:type IV pilus assembly protein PilV